MVPVEHSEGTDQTGITSTTHIPGTPVCGVAFTTPASGRVWINLYGYIGVDTAATGTRRMSLTFEIRTGSTIGSGTVAVGTDDVDHAIGVSPGVVATSVVLIGGFRYLAALTPNTAYNVRTMHRVSGASTTGQILHRRISVEDGT